MFDVILDDNFSFLEEEIYVKNRPSIPVTVPSYKTNEVVKRNGTLTFYNNFPDRNINIEFNFVDRINVSRRIRKILNKILFCKKIKFTDDMDIYYKVKMVSLDSPERSYRHKCDFSVTFTLEPFAYLENEPIELLASNTIYNCGTYESEPNIKLYGTGDLKLTINSKSFTVANVSEYVDINSNLFRCNKGATNKLSDMTGDFPLLEVGDNEIVLGTNVTKVIITPNFRYL